MTEITCLPKECEIEMKGHSEYAPAGTDIVCAAATILLYTLIENLNDPKYRTEIYINDGYAHVKCFPYGNDMDHCVNLFEAFYQGYRLLAEKYPENVAIMEGEHL